MTTASKNQGRHAQSVEDIIRVCMQSTVSEALFQRSAYSSQRLACLLWHGDCGLYCLKIHVTATAAVVCQPACIASCLVAGFHNHPFSSQIAHRQLACLQVRLGHKMLPSLQIAYPIQCSCQHVGSQHSPCLPRTSLHLGAGACHGHCSSFKAEQKLGWAAC